MSWLRFVQRGYAGLLTFWFAPATPTEAKANTAAGGAIGTLHAASPQVPAKVKERPIHGPTGFRCELAPGWAAPSLRDHGAAQVLRRPRNRIKAARLMVTGDALPARASALAGFSYARAQVLPFLGGTSMKVLSVTTHSPATMLRVAKEIGFTSEDITRRYPFALTVAEDVVYVHVGGVTIGLPYREFVQQASQFNVNEFPRKED